MKKVLILSNDSGGGHRQTARILTQTLSDRSWNPKIVSIYREIFPDYFHLFGIPGETFYNKLILTHEMTDWIYRLFFISAYYFIIRLQRHKLMTRLLDFWRQEQPDLVISIIPLVNQVVADSLSQFEPQTPLIIIQTDLFEFHEPFWLTPQGTWFVSDGQTYTVVGTEDAYQQVTTSFVSDPKRVFKLSGNLVDPRFMTRPSVERWAERQKIGLAAEKPVGLFLYGGFSPNRLLETAKGLNRLEHDAQFIFVCGHNDRLQQQLDALDTHYHKLVVGFTLDIPYYMHLSDFLISKPGPGVIMEGLAADLPLLIDSRRVMLHESLNIDWVKRHGFGLSFDSVQQLLDRIEQLFVSGLYDHLKQNVTHFENRAAWEIPEIIEAILAHFQRDVRAVSPSVYHSETWLV